MTETIILTQRQIDRFWGKVRQGDPWECWLWTGSTNGSSGHGIFQIVREGKVKTLSAGRVSFFLTYGYWPKITRRTCGVPACVNPSHLSDGQEHDNDWRNDRFWEKVQIGKPDGCWLWTGATTAHGVGLFTYNGSRRSARKIAIYLSSGVWPVYVDSLCGTPACVNPQHLTTAPREYAKEVY